MSKVWFCSDLHLGHRSIIRFSPYRFGFRLDSVAEHDEYIKNVIHSKVKKRDTVFFLGDVCFDMEQMAFFNTIDCSNKYLIRGNHDKFNFGVYRKHFDDIFGIRTYKGFWLSHAPVHPAETRNRVNIHGHVHSNTVLREKEKTFFSRLWPGSSRRMIEDERYINVCPENHAFWEDEGVLIPFDEIKEKTK